MDIPAFNVCVEESIRAHWDLDALTDYQASTLQYKDVARIIEKLHIIFEYSGVKKGDRIAICGRNTSRWGAVFMATLTYGAVAVPILHEFKAEQIHNIVNHSESKLLFVGDQVWPELNSDEMPALEGVISIADYSLLVCRTEKVRYAREHLNQLFGEKFPMNFRPHHVSYHKDTPEELAMINYTSGTTSNSKGVMIPYRALWSNLDFANKALGVHMKPGDNVISMLPMAHMYGMAFEFIFEFCMGAHVHFLTRMPSPKILFKAFTEIKPAVIIAVPLIIEKIIRKVIFPKLQTGKMKMLMKIPVINQKIKDKICEQMRDAFGGQYYEVIVGGAAFNREIEDFLHDIGFNYTVGYGATECAPIISYADWKEFCPGSCGKAAPRMELRINSKDPQHEVGEIWTRGANVMLGYYKNEEATRETLDRDGWYHTGDLGVIDAEGNLFIKGRCKNMLLGASGQNIYPEEIEDKLNTLMLVNESIVIQKGEKLYGLVYPDFDEARKLGLQDTDLESVMEQNRQDLNAQLPAYSQLSGIKIYQEEFEKTPKKSIKRFLYTDVEI
ncbi:MAG: AMP-binding protein [Paraprevotella sp.]|nr:AMP-binding protein [Paraprevotella sp.]